MCKHEWLYSVGLTGSEMVHTTPLRWFRRCLSCDRFQYLLWNHEYYKRVIL